MCARLVGMTRARESFDAFICSIYYYDLRGRASMGMIGGESLLGERRGSSARLTILF